MDVVVQLIVIVQVRLCLDRKDYMRAQILSRKVSTRAFVVETGKDKKKPKEGDNVVVEPPPDVPSLLELKRIYYDLMIRYGLFLYEHEFLSFLALKKSMYLSACGC